MGTETFSGAETLVGVESLDVDFFFSVLDFRRGSDLIIGGSVAGMIGEHDTLKVEEEEVEEEEEEEEMSSGGGGDRNSWMVSGLCIRPTEVLIRRRSNDAGG